MGAETAEAMGRSIRSRQNRTRRRRAWLALAVISALFAALIGGAVWAYRALYSPAAFVSHYLSLLHDGRAADALALPGVSLTPQMLKNSAIDSNASTALLRRDALGPLEDIEIIEQRREGNEYIITASYRAGNAPGSTEFRVMSDGWRGLAPAWRFIESPIAQLDVRVMGSEQFRVNNFDLDRLQINPADDPAAPMSLLVFSPGMYAIEVDTRIAQADPVGFLSDVPLQKTPMDVRAAATSEFTERIQDQVNEVLDNCVKKKVLLPANCPFGRFTSDLLLQEPNWSVVSYPTVTLEPRGVDWVIRPMDGAVHLYAPVQLLVDGTKTAIDENVGFFWAGSVHVQADGTAAIRLGTPTEFGF